MRPAYSMRWRLGNLAWPTTPRTGRRSRGRGRRRAARGARSGGLCDAEAVGGVYAGEPRSQQRLEPALSFRARTGLAVAASHHGRAWSWTAPLTSAPPKGPNRTSTYGSEAATAKGTSYHTTF